MYSGLQVKRELASVVIFESHAKAGTVCESSLCPRLAFLFSVLQECETAKMRQLHPPTPTLSTLQFLTQDKKTGLWDIQTLTIVKQY